MRICFTIFLLYILLFCYCNSASADTSSEPKITELTGVVYKRGFAEGEKGHWADPSPAAMGDTICDGMQLGSGIDSTAEVVWDNITLRSRGNTLYTLLPSQQVIYLIGGEVLFNHDRNSKNEDDYTFWTSNLQVTAKGTTFLLTEGKDGSRVAVLEGIVEIVNRLDDSIVTLKPGMVYEAKQKGNKGKSGKNDSDNGKGRGRHQGNSKNNSGGIADTSGLIGGLDVLGLEALTRESSANLFSKYVNFELVDLPGTVYAIGDVLEQLLLFDTPHYVSYISSVPGDLLLKDRLFFGFTKSLANQKHIEKTLMKNLNTKGSILKALTINQVPIKSIYSIGGDVTQIAKISDVSFLNWPPSTVLPTGFDPLNTGRQLGLKKYHIAYHRKTTKVNAVLMNAPGMSKGTIAGIPVLTLIPSKGTNPLNVTSLTAGRGGATSLIPGLSKGSASPVGGLNLPLGGLTGRNGVLAPLGGLLGK